MSTRVFICSLLIQCFYPRSPLHTPCLPPPGLSQQPVCISCVSIPNTPPAPCLQPSFLRPLGMGPGLLHTFPPRALRGDWSVKKDIKGHKYHCFAHRILQLRPLLAEVYSPSWAGWGISSKPPTHRARQVSGAVCSGLQSLIRSGLPTVGSALPTTQRHHRDTLQLESVQSPKLVS